MQIERKAASTVKIWEAVGDRYGGREKKMNDPEKGRRNCWAEGLDKSVIVKNW